MTNNSLANNAVIYEACLRSSGNCSNYESMNRNTFNVYRKQLNKNNFALVKVQLNGNYVEKLQC